MYMYEAMTYHKQMFLLSETLVQIMITGGSFNEVLFYVTCLMNNLTGCS